ncbi:hypothetical protein [Devosia sp. A369]
MITLILFASLILASLAAAGLIASTLGSDETIRATSGIEPAMISASRSAPANRV